MTTYRAIYISATHWLTGIALSFLVFWNMNAFYITAGVGIGLCLSVSTGCYIQSYRIVRQHQLQIYAQQVAVDRLNAVENKQNLQRTKTSAKNTFIYYIVMLLCYTPLFISLIILGPPQFHSAKAWALVGTVVYTNSSVIPVLYCWRLRDLRTAVVKTWRQMFSTQTEETYCQLMFNTGISFNFRGKKAMVSEEKRRNNFDVACGGQFTCSVHFTVSALLAKKC